MKHGFDIKCGNFKILNPQSVSSITPQTTYLKWFLKVSAQNTKFTSQVFCKNKPDFIPATATLTSSSDVKAATAELQELVSFWQTSSTEKSKVKRHKNMFLLYIDSEWQINRTHLKVQKFNKIQFKVTENLIYLCHSVSSQLLQILIMST